MKIPFGAWMPDQPALNNPGSSLIKNVIPGSMSYLPMPSLTVYSDAIDARCQGAATITDSDGNVTNFAGDATKLYSLISGTMTWTDVSKVGNYTTPTDGRWSFAVYKNQMLAANYSDPIQEFTLGSSTTFDDLSATAPSCKYLAVAKNFLFAINTNDSNDGPQPQRIWWPEIGDPSNWPTPGTSNAIAAQSDYQDLLGEGGWNTGGVGGLSGADLVIFQERAMWRATYVGGDEFWQFDQVEGARGTSAPGSIVQIGGRAFYLGEDGFYVTDGATSIPIGAEKFDKTFFSDLDQGRYDRISAAADPINKIYICGYPSKDSVDGRIDKLLVYKWQADKASLIEGVEAEVLFRSLSFGYTMDSLDAIAPNLDEFEISLDSRALTGGRMLLSAFDTSHRLNYFTGPALEATLETTEAQPIPNKRAKITEIWPLVNGGTVSVTPVTRNRNVDSVTVGTASSQNSVGYCPVRTNARYHRYRVVIAAGGTWTHAQGIDVPEDKVTSVGAR